MYESASVKVPQEILLGLICINKASLRVLNRFL